MPPPPCRPKATSASASAAVDLHGGADLLDLARVHHDDAVGERHRLDLIVGDEDRGGADLLVETGELDAGAHPQRRVEVGERLVEEIGLRVLHECAADGDALLLAA